MKSVEVRLKLLSLISIGALLLLSLVAAGTLFSQQRSVDRLIDQRLRTYTTLNAMETLIYSNHSNIQRLVNWANAGYEPAKLEALAGEIVRLQEQGDALEQRLARAGLDPADMAVIGPTFAKYGKQLRDIADIAPTGAAMATMFLGRADTLFLALKVALEHLSATETAAMQREGAAVHAVATRGLLLFLGVAGATALATWLYSARLARGIGGPLRFLSGQVEHSLRERDLTLRVPERGADEIGQLSRAFNALNGSFQAFFLGTGDQSVRIASGAEQLASGSEQMARTSELMGQGAGVLRQSSLGLDQATRIIVGAIQEVDALVASLGVRSHEALATADTGARSGLVTLEAMDGIQRTSQAMQSAVLVIEDIANQTNLLSLNAAIEAAKAGQSGKGFAVVAEEVRKLADRSAQASRQIHSLIQDVRGAITEGTRNVAETVGSLKGISTSMAEITQLVGRIEAAARSQAQASVEAETQGRRVGEEVTHNEAAISELSNAIHEVARTASDLAAISESMRVLVGGYRVR